MVVRLKGRRWRGGGLDKKSGEKVSAELLEVLVERVLLSNSGGWH